MAAGSRMLWEGDFVGDWLQPSDETGRILTWTVKVVSLGISFLGGVVTATWIVATKVKGFDDRLQAIESVQTQCPGKTLVGIDEQIDALPGKIDAKIEEKLNRIHERIDEILLRGKGGSL